MSDAREVIARAIFDTDFSDGMADFMGGWCEETVHWEPNHTYADAIIAALDAAGWQVVRKGESRLPPSGPSNTITREPWPFKSKD